MKLVYELYGGNTKPAENYLGRWEGDIQFGKTIAEGTDYDYFLVYEKRLDDEGNVQFFEVVSSGEYVASHVIEAAFVWADKEFP